MDSKHSTHTALLLVALTLAAGSPAGGGEQDPCTGAGLRAAEAGRRVAEARRLVFAGCRPLPTELRAALHHGRWWDGATFSDTERGWLLEACVAAHDAGAESLAVSLLRGGIWPDGSELEITTGDRLIPSLRGRLDQERVILLLDIWDQVHRDATRLAVLAALQECDRPESWLPALDAWAHPGTSVADSAAAILGRAEGGASGTLERVIKTLPKGPLLNWGLDIAKQNPSPGVVRAAAARAAEK